jgi:hypothetical protein
MRPASLQPQTNRLGTATTGKIFSAQALPAAWHVTAVFCSSSEPRNPSTIHSGEAPKKKLVQVLALDRAMGILRPTQAGDACDGQVAEWLKAHAWNACIRATVSRVRIPLCPPFLFPRHWIFLFLRLAYRSTHHSGRGRPGLSTICPNYAHAALFPLQPEASLLIA